MNSDDDGAQATLADLREGFERAFREPPPPPAPARRRLLAIRAGGAPFAFDVGELAAIDAGTRLCRLPRSAASVRVAGFRGRLIAVHSLAAMLESAGPPEGGRWIAICLADPSLALEFDELEGIHDVPLDRINPVSGDAEGLVEAVLADSRHVRGIVSIRHVLARIRRSAR